MGFLLTAPIVVPFVLLVSLVLYLLFKPPAGVSNTKSASSQPRTTRVTYVTDSEGWLKKVVHEDVDDVVSSYASRMGKDE